MNTAGVVAELGLQVLQIDEPLGIALDGDGVEPGERGAGRVGAVGAVGDEHLLAVRLAHVAEVRGRDVEGGQFALAPAAGWSDTAGSPEISMRKFCISQRTSSIPWVVSSS